MSVQEVSRRLKNFAYLIHNLIHYAGVQTNERHALSASMLRRFYDKNERLNRYNWRSIYLLEKYGMTTYKKLVDEFKFAGKYKKLFVYKKDEKGVFVPVAYKSKKPALSEVDYADYMNEVMNQEAEAEHAFDEEFEAAAKTVYEEQVAKELKVQMSMKEEKELEKFNKEEEKNANTVTTFLTGNEEVDELEAIMFGEPEDIEAFAECLIEARNSLELVSLLPVSNEESPYKNPDLLSDEGKAEQEARYKDFKRNEDNIPCVEAQTYPIASFDEMCELIKKSFVGAHFPTKVAYTLHFIVESHFASGIISSNTTQGENGVYYQPAAMKRSIHINSKNFVVSQPTDINEFIKKVKEELSGFIIDPNNFFRDTKSLFIACYAFTLCKYNIAATGTVCPELEIFAAYDKANTIRVHGEAASVKDNLCVFRAIAEALIIEKDVPKSVYGTHRDRYITKRAKELFQQFYESKYPWKIDEDEDKVKFTGFFIEEGSLMKLSKVFGIGFDLYDFKPESKKLQYKGNFSASANFKNYSFIEYDYSETSKSHMMFVPNIAKIQNSITCRFCNQVMFKNTDKGRRCLKQHEAQCENKNNDNTQTLKTDFERPYCPVFYNNKLYVYMLTHGLKEYYKPMKYYMTYDFETMDSLIKGDEFKMNVDAATQKLAYLKPFSVAVAWKTRNNTNKQYFCLYDLINGELRLRQDFVEQWLNFCLKTADEVAAANYDYFVEDMNKNGIKINEELESLIREWSSDVNIVGWNSAKFDSNFLLQHISEQDPKNIFIMGNQGNNKLVTFKTEQGNTLVFCDGCNYASKCTLDKATQSFGGNKERVKGVYPYSIMTDDRVKEVLLETKPFPIESFFNSLTQQPLSQDLYNKYVEDFKNYKNFYEYTQYYNEQDCIIMFDIIDNLVAKYWELSLDMFTEVSFSSLASSAKYLSCYEDFDVNEYYAVEEDNSSEFVLSQGSWNYMVNSYKNQDKKAKRDFEKNVKAEDFEHFKKIFAEESCHICHSKFTFKNKPTLDRLDNEKGHSIDNVKPCCLYCNCYCSNKDKQTQQFYIQLRRYAIKNNLPFSIENPFTLQVLKEGITGGLSNVHHRMNIAGKNTITKLQYKNNEVHIINTDNIITHCVGVDCNSMYPSSYGSIPHEFCKYTDNVMYMPGKVIDQFEIRSREQFDKAMKIIHQEERFSSDATLFVAKIKGHIPKERLNKCINFLPIFRNIPVKMNEATLGKYMIDYYNKVYQADYNRKYPCEEGWEYEPENRNLNKTVKKLTQTYATFGFNGEFDEYQVFSSYYLWFLIDQFGFVVDDIRYIATFTKHTAFNKFVTRCANKRVMAKFNKDSLIDEFYKLILNSSYGFDSIRTDKFHKSFITDYSGAMKAHKDIKHIDTQRLTVAQYLVFQKNKSYKIKTPIQCAAFTLDNAKYWYLNFIYNFMERCLDMNKIHFVEGDTDSMYWAISGDKNRDETQYFDAVIKDKEFYYANWHKWLPNKFGEIPVEHQLKFENAIAEKFHEKKLLGFAVEKASYNMVALMAKCYTAYGRGSEHNKVLAIKIKGVSKQTNNYTQQDYIDVIERQEAKYGVNYLLRYVNCGKDEQGNTIYKYARIRLYKTSLTGLHFKMQVHDDNCQTCTPLYLPVANEKSVAEEYVHTDCLYPIQDYNWTKDSMEVSYYETAYNMYDQKYKKPVCNFAFGVPNYLKHPIQQIKRKWIVDTMKLTDEEKIMEQMYPKACRHFGEAQNPASNIGVNLNVAESPYAVIDFDINKSLPIEEIDRIAQEIINKFGFKKGIVRTANGGLHIYCKADIIPKYLSAKSRWCKNVLPGFENVDVDVFVPHTMSDEEIARGMVNQSYVVYPGSQVYSKVYKRVNSYSKIDCSLNNCNWSFLDIEDFVAVYSRISEIIGQDLVNSSECFTPIKLPQKWYTMDHRAQQIIIANESEESKTNYKMNSLKSAYYETLKNCTKKGDWQREFKPEFAEKPDWETIHKLQYIDVIHGHDSNSILQVFQLCSLFACYSDEDYLACMDWVYENCNISTSTQTKTKTQYPNAQAVRSSMKATFAANSQLKKKIQLIESKGWNNQRA